MSSSPHLKHGDRAWTLDPPLPRRYSLSRLVEKSPPFRWLQGSPLARVDLWGTQGPCRSVMIRPAGRGSSRAASVIPGRRWRADLLQGSTGRAVKHGPLLVALPVRPPAPPARGTGGRAREMLLVPDQRVIARKRMRRHLDLRAVTAIATQTIELIPRFVGS